MACALEDWSICALDGKLRWLAMLAWWHRIVAHAIDLLVVAGGQASFAALPFAMNWILKACACGKRGDFVCA